MHRLRPGGWALAAALSALALLAPGLRSEESAGKASFVGSETCLNCHEDKKGFEKEAHARSLLNVKKIEFNKACETCHGPGSLHAEAAGDKTNPGFATVSNAKNLKGGKASEACLQCHKDQKQVALWNTSAHRQQDLSCADCHSMHAATEKKQLKKTATDTCTDCHKKQKNELQLASHHPVIEGKMSCTGCHNPHGGVEGNLKGETVEETCFKCHADKAGPYAHEHPPVVESCANCHKPHGSQSEALLKQPQVYLCLRCHKFPHVNRTAGIAMSVNLFEQRGRCTDCHREIHGSDRHQYFKN